MEYQLTNGPQIIRTTDGATIGADPANSDYQAYLEWLAAGNKPDPAAVVSAWPAHRAAALESLQQSDITMLRCFENQVSAPAEWIAYRNSLRAIMNAPTGDATQPLPAKPAYPAGT